MKTIIGLLIFVLAVFAGVNILIIFKDLELSSFNNTWFSMPLTILSGIGFYYLVRLDDFFSEKELARLNKKVIQETRRLLKNPEGYELWPTLTCYLLFLLIIALMGIAPVYFGIKLLYEFHETVMVILLILMILFGLFFGFGMLHSFLLLVGRPVLRINRQGLSHFMMDFIDWHDVTGLYLQAVAVKGIKHHSLEIYVRNPEFYKNKHKNLFGRYFQREHISLYLPVSEENAMIAEAVAIAYSKRRYRSKH
ncbi:hypothetical protein MCAMS1_02586 [biofilm metagenome]